ncbi:hypothetical protein CEN44_01975 [Fischerella muscicola CCMEE 5323]|uniref:Uncharacterized protein n=1 Tax=Fischerella muscicola CCMEE 5323 TaxID=2019572 RepID=A0A2N6K8C7_FISMU|nr:hypothetical protein CEN44_01975 [Fischerella muscicola CCMEE 5323]
MLLQINKKLTRNINIVGRISQQDSIRIYMTYFDSKISHSIFCQNLLSIKNDQKFLWIKLLTIALTELVRNADIAAYVNSD